MKIEILAVAAKELVEAVSFYNEQKRGLGYEFASEIKKAIERIRRFPKAWAQLSERTHRCQTKRFPYGVIYQVREDVILIVAISHLRRHPDSWKSRLGSK